MFAYGDEKKKRHGRTYYTSVVRTMANNDGLLSGCSAHSYFEKSKTAVDRLLTHTDAKRDAITVRKIVKESFVQEV